MSTYLIYIASILSSVIFNAFIEWIVHGPFMHGRFATTVLRNDHINHHDEFEGPRYRSATNRQHVHLPWWSVFLTIAPSVIIGLIVSTWIGLESIFWCVTGTSIMYYYAYQYVHTLMHIPNENRFDRMIKRTRIFQALDRHHRVHHLEAMSNPWGKMVNIGLLCTLGDHVFRTKFKRKS